jgi:hypothetical protein
MCDFTHILTLFLVAEGVLIGVVVAMGFAAAANASVFGAPAGAIAFGVALVAYVAAIAFVNSVSGTLAFPSCNSAGCAMQHVAAVGALRNLQLAMGAAAIAAAAATLAGAVPIVGAIGIGASAIAIAAVGVLLPVAARALSVLQSCLSSTSPSTGATVSKAVAWVIGIFMIGGALALLGPLRNAGSPFGPPDRKPTD